MGSVQTLDEADRRLLARWAADCAARVLPLVDADAETMAVIDDALGRTRAYGAGESTSAEEIGKRMLAVKAAGAVPSPAGAAAGRSVAQASAVAHMGAHALGAAAYAVKAVSSAARSDDTVAEERAWQLAHLDEEHRTALARLPLLGTDSSGPLGPGLLSGGILGETIRLIQADVGTR